MGRRIITTDRLEEDKVAEKSLRPHSFDDYIGQEKVKENLKGETLFFSYEFYQIL